MGLCIRLYMKMARGLGTRLGMGLSIGLGRGYSYIFFYIQITKRHEKINKTNEISARSEKRKWVKIGLRNVLVYKYTK